MALGGSGMPGGQGPSAGGLGQQQGQGGIEDIMKALSEGGQPAGEIGQQQMNPLSGIQGQGAAVPGVGTTPQGPQQTANPLEQIFQQNPQQAQAILEALFNSGAVNQGSVPLAGGQALESTQGREITKQSQLPQGSPLPDGVSG